MADMYKPPEAVFAEWYSKHVVRFLFTMAELYSDVKTANKRYAAAVQACRARKDCQVSFHSPAAFKEVVFAILGMLADHAIYQGEPLACFVTFELLPLTMKRSLKDSRWWLDLAKARINQD